jgi:hypothetical protein
VWIRGDLVREVRIRPKDCFPVRGIQRVDKVVTKLSFTRDILAGGGATYADILKRAPMVEGGRWV